MNGNDSETLFYEAMENIFCGAQVAGKGGFINLLSIKRAYYNKILKIFKKKVSECQAVSGSARRELFDRLYTFFRKYFNECGSVYFQKTSYEDKIYEQVYTNNKDVVLFYKTSMLYYVKTDAMYSNMLITAIGADSGKQATFAFDESELENKQNNEKKSLVFTFTGYDIPAFSINDEKITNKAYILQVHYSQKGTATKFDEIAKAANLPDDVVKKACAIFTKQSSVDYFINKDAKKFLTEQLDLYLHQILLDEENKFEKNRLEQLKAFKSLAADIIDFIAQAEDELARVWNKMKFPLGSNYVITLDRLPKELIDKAAKSAGLPAQIKEWQDLGMVDDAFDFGKREGKHKYLPLDTKYFKELEGEILALFDNLDDALDGRLIHSENYQALNTMQRRYRGKVQCVYIDPPFNTGSDFAYIDNYQDATWLSIMHDRLELARQFLKSNGSVFVHLDFNADYRGRELCNHIFGNDNFLNTLSWGYRSGGASKSTALPYKHDSILYYSRDEEHFQYNPVTERQYYEKPFMGCKKDASGRFYNDTLLRDCFEGVVFDPVLNIEFNTRKVLNLSNEFFSFENSQKPEGLLHLLETIGSNEKDIVMDFFAGSATSIAVAQKTNKKWIGVEMGDHFNNFYDDVIEYKNTETNKINICKDFIVLELSETDDKLVAIVRKVGALGRLKEVLACIGRHEPCGISSNVNWQGGGFFKYYSMEQYEDTLKQMRYNDGEVTLFDEKNPFDNYMFLTDEKFSGVLSIEGLEGKASDINAKLDFGALYPDIDFAETISLVKGQAIKRISGKSVTLADGNTYSFDFDKMTADEKVNFAQMLKPFLWWGE